jgi:hypothetical protein
MGRTRKGEGRGGAFNLASPICVTGALIVLNLPVEWDIFSLCHTRAHSRINTHTRTHTHTHHISRNPTQSTSLYNTPSTKTTLSYTTSFTFDLSLYRDFFFFFFLSPLDAARVLDQVNLSFLHAAEKNPILCTCNGNRIEAELCELRKETSNL